MNDKCDASEESSQSLGISCSRSGSSVNSCKEPLAVDTNISQAEVREDVSGIFSWEKEWKKIGEKRRNDAVESQ